LVLSFSLVVQSKPIERESFLKNKQEKYPPKLGECLLQSEQVSEDKTLKINQRQKIIQ